VVAYHHSGRYWVDDAIENLDYAISNWQEDNPEALREAAAKIADVANRLRG
jgi:hypothetical protein